MAVFQDHEEIFIEPIYRDPVHDFGLYRFDPAAVRFMDVRELALAPEAARVGMEIRVVGNDAGEKISILDGTLARLDRNAPDYGSDTYNDFNTFYFQAASNTSGGSSGSPVVDASGRVVALNAGGRRSAASSYYLPLDRVVRAVKLVVAGEPVTRGTLQTVWTHAPYDEVARLGVDDAVLAGVRERFPQGSGMLAVSEVVPEGPAWGQLEPGDVLLEIDGEPMVDFVSGEAALDARVGSEVTVEVLRAGAVVQAALQVQDLHAISPDRFVEASRGVFNELSYQVARNHGVPVGGVYVASSGYAAYRAGIPSGAVITEVDGVPISDLDAWWRALGERADGESVRIRFHRASDPRRDAVAVMRMDRRWFPLRLCQRDDSTGGWPCEEAAPPPPAPPVELAAPFLPLAAPDKVSARVSRSLVMVDFDIPHATAGVKDFNYIGAGVIVDADRGLVVVDRDTVPVGLGDIMLTFGGSVRVQAELVWLDPQHNFAILRYPPKAVDRGAVDSAELLVAPLEPGVDVWQVGVDSQYAVVSQPTEIKGRGPLRVGASGTPRYRDHNVEVVDTVDAAPSLGGVLADRRGRVVALWASFINQESGDRTFHGLPSAYLVDVLAAIRRGERPEVHDLGAELTPIALPDARDLGLSGARAAQLALAHPEGKAAPLAVVRRTGGAPARELLRDGDIVLELDGEPLVRMSQLRALRDRPSARLLVLREGQELELEVPTVALDGQGVDRVVSWAGLVLHAPHPEVAQQRGIDPSGVYIAWLWDGSPASRYGLRPTWRIIEIDDTPVNDVDALLAAVAGAAEREPVRLKLEALDGKVSVSTVTPDLRYWPTLVMEYTPSGWTRVVTE